MKNCDNPFFGGVGALTSLRLHHRSLRISAGYIYSENAMPDAHYSPLIADSARHRLSIGTGHKGRRFDFDIAYQFGIGDGVRTVSGSAPSATGQTADGRYTYISHAVLGTVGWHF